MQIKDVWEQGGIGRADGEILLRSLLGRDRSWIFAHAEHEIPCEHLQTLEKWMRRRKDGEPVAYILHQQEFFGRSFIVNPHVLIPRPSTEGLAELALEMVDAPVIGDVLRTIDTGIVAYAQRWKDDAFATVADIGTGSGCIAVALACERPTLRIIATDVSDDALRVARENAQKQNVADHIDLRRGSLLEPLRDQREPFLLVSNIPYVPERYELPKEVSHEPHVALFGGPDGTDVLLPLVQEARKHPACVGFIVECREDQVARITHRA